MLNCWIMDIFVQIYCIYLIFPAAAVEFNWWESFSLLRMSRLSHSLYYFSLSPLCCFASQNHQLTLKWEFQFFCIFFFNQNCPLTLIYYFPHVHGQETDFFLCSSPRVCVIADSERLQMCQRKSKIDRAWNRAGCQETLAFHKQTNTIKKGALCSRYLSCWN